MDAMIGRTLGNYRITDQLGKGGMATVYKAYHAALDRYVAIKVLPEYFAHDPSFFERFQQEAQAVARLRHPHIMQVFDFGRDGDLTYLVMEYVEGGTLQERLGKPLALADALRITRQVADALGYAHGHGIIHRDVKPSNILLTKDGDAILSDFGIAKMVERAVSLTKTGVGVGTPEYMAPEQGQGLPVDGRSDIYSLGVVLYEMATGRVPYIADTPLAIVLKHMNEPLLLPQAINPALPDAVQRMILSCMAKHPADRYQSAEALIQAVDNILASGAAAGPQAMTMPEGITTRKTPPPPIMTPPPVVQAQTPPPAAAQPPVQQPSTSTPPPASAYPPSQQPPPYAPPQQQPTYPAAQQPPAYPPPQQAYPYPPAQQPYGYPPSTPPPPSMTPGYGQARKEQPGALRGILLGAIGVVLLLIFGGVAALGGFALRDRLNATATPTATSVIPGVLPAEATATTKPGAAGTATPTARPGAATATPTTHTTPSPVATLPTVTVPAIGTATPASTTVLGAIATLAPATRVATATNTSVPPAASTATPPRTTTPAATATTPAKPASFSGRIVYTHYRGPSRYGDFDIMIMDVPGGTPRKIADRGSEPAFSPDGRSIIFYNWNQSGFFIMNPDGSGQRRISTSGEDAYPAWSRDGKRIAFTLYENRFNIWIMNADGSGRTKIVDGGEQPSWSPDGSRIVYKGCVGANCGLVVVNADGSNKQLLTDNANDSSPAWSPGGGYILFTTNRSGNLDVWVMRSDGSGKQQLTTNPTSDGAATWSPDGNYIFFRSDRDGSWGIYMMNDDGSDQRKVVAANVSERWWWERISVSW